MALRKLVVVSSASLLAGMGLLSPLPTSASSGGPNGFEPAPYQEGLIPAVQPLAADPDRLVTVMLQLSGDSVAEAKAKAPGHEIDAGRKQQIKDSLKTNQDALTPAIQARGGRVLTQHQSSLNGLTVDAPAARLAELGALPGVVAVWPVATFTPDLTQSVPFIGAPQVWDGGSGFHGEGVRVGIIDTGIDYTHANFAGPGTAQAFQAEKQRIRNGEQPNPAIFGPDAPKVKGGIDLVGDDYNASDPDHNVPHPSTSPLDCNGHGSHVAGIAAGFGERPDGSTYRGPYETNTESNPFRIGPGVAPRADLFAIRVFGCEGSTRVVVDALDWAIDHDMQVVNMSLGSAYGTPQDASAVASQNTANAGIVVVASAGNSGPAPYIAGSPSVGKGAISVAAVDSGASFPGARVSLSTGQTITVQNSNGAAFTDGTTLPVKVLRNPNGTVSLGCQESDYSGVAGTLVVTLRGDCARVFRAQAGQRHGAAAVAMIDTSTGFPPFEGDIPGVTIPFFGVRGLLGGNSDGDRLVAADGGSATLAKATVANPGFRHFASFTSAGPAGSDSTLKPDISAPGVSILSTGSGTGNLGVRISGTSQAAPHVAGSAALAVQAHPGWEEADVRAAIVNTANPSKVDGFQVNLGGSGLVQPFPATRTSVVALTRDGDTNLSFGFEEFSRDFRDSKAIRLHNLGDSAVTFDVSSRAVGGSPHSVRLGQTTISLRAGDRAQLRLDVIVPAATVGNSGAFRQVSGLMTLTPRDGGNGDVTLTVPYYLVPRARSDIDGELSEDLTPEDPSSSAVLTNRSPAVTGSADFFAWGLAGEDRHHVPPASIRAVGAQSFPRGASDRTVVMALNRFGRWSVPNVFEFAIPIDTTGSGTPDKILLGTDFGRLTTGSFSGQMASVIVDLTKPTGDPARIRPQFLLNSVQSGLQTDGSVIMLPFRASVAGLTAASPRFTYGGASVTNLFTREVGIVGGTARFNAFRSAISQGQFAIVNPGRTVSVPVSIDPAEFSSTPALGLMVVATENAAGQDQTILLDAGDGKHKKK